MNILGIETSCDETGVSVVTGDKRILSNLVLSQVKEHAAFGGVVPEIAARAHLDHIDTLIKGAMHDAKLDFTDLDGIAATCGPGLIGGVMVGMMAAKAIAAAHNKPLIAVNHLEAHALTPRLTETDLEFPYLLLLVSGGHSQILIVEGVGQYKRLGTTLDDALGECFDKSAKLMGLPFPGGPNLEKIALECADPDQALLDYPLPRPMTGRKDPDFSFSGLKTAVRQHIDAMPDPMPRASIAALAHAFQCAVVDILKDRCAVAINQFLQTYSPNAPALIVSGGVAANMKIRGALQDLTAAHKMAFIAPPLNLCSDNGAMIAWAGIERLRLGLTDPLDVAARPRWPLDPEAEAKIGAGVKA